MPPSSYLNLFDSQRRLFLDADTNRIPKKFDNIFPDALNEFQSWKIVSEGWKCVRCAPASRYVPPFSELQAVFGTIRREIWIIIGPFSLKKRRQEAQHFKGERNYKKVDLHRPKNKWTGRVISSFLARKGNILEAVVVFIARTKMYKNEPYE